MIIKIRLLTLAVASALCVSTALASEIYRYVDEDGNVLYRDIPSGDPSEEHLDVRSRPTNDAAVQANVKSSQEARAEQAKYAAEQKVLDDAEKMTPGERRDLAAARQDKCQENRDRLLSYVASRRLYQEDDNGERVYLSDDEAQAASDRVQALIDENCS